MMIFINLRFLLLHQYFTFRHNFINGGGAETANKNERSNKIPYPCSDSCGLNYSGHVVNQATTKVPESRNVGAPV